MIESESTNNVDIEKMIQTRVSEITALLDTVHGTPSEKDSFLVVGKNPNSSELFDDPNRSNIDEDNLSTLDHKIS